MYLAKLQHGATAGYQLRQSYRTTEDTFGYRIVHDLGPDPGRWLEPFGDRLVLFDHRLVDAVAAHAEGAEGDSESLLERLLWEFLPKEIQWRLAPFINRGGARPGPLSRHERQEIDRQVHLFDRRRLYFLRYGAVDQSRLFRLHEKCCRPLLGQSRDEREYYFTAEEAALAPGQYLRYIHAIFDLQRYFRESFAPWLPEALARDEMADRFVEELCRLNGDRQFWQSEQPASSLHRHLVRYLIMFFDHRPAPRSFAEEFIRTFMAGHRTFRWPERKSTASPERISEIFAASPAELKQMSRAQLSRLYRKKAMQLHPDRGGDHDLFIELTEVYHELLRGK